MSGIAGIAQPGQRDRVEQMLTRIAHRGPAGCQTVEVKGNTLGVVWPKPQAKAAAVLQQGYLALDEAGHGHRAQAQAEPGKIVLRRGPLGVAPLYYGYTNDGALCFASEVKALLTVTRDVHELPPGHKFDGDLQPYFQLSKQPPLRDQEPTPIAKELRSRLAAAVEKRIQDGPAGSWLSGGLDSSTMAALARPKVKNFHTFAVGLDGAPDLLHARTVATFIQAEHHEWVVKFSDLLAALPQVIYHLESFDALLVRSSMVNYLVAKMAADYVPMVFSGEGGDELFAGYSYLKQLDPAVLPDELLDITRRLHNTALQRVDRSASAHGTVAHVAFLDPDVVDYALRIPVKYKLHQGVEKWILRQAVADALPPSVLNRTKAKFWHGAGVGSLFADYAEDRITETEFERERVLPNGWKLNSKEELLYYRIFRDHFGDLADLDWMGRTKGAPVS